LRFGQEDYLERLVHGLRNRLAGGDAAELQGSANSPLGLDSDAFAVHGHMRFQPIERGKPEPPGNRLALVWTGDQIDSLAPPDPVERQPVAEILFHQN
jgi:hypothetical protein